MDNAVNAPEFEVTDFTSDVIDASYEQPVLVDFWAPWCGPCRTLGPLLEKMAQATDEWTLVKVNTDENPDEARKYGVRGIPAVKLFVDGSVADEFTGALPRHQIERWLEEALPGESAQKLEAARKQLEAGETEAARAKLEELIAEDASNHNAHVLLARTVMFDEPERAQSLLEGHITDAESRETAETVETVSRLLTVGQRPDDLPDEDGKDAYLEAIRALAAQEFSTALEQFIQVIQTNRYYDDDGARKACVAIFALLGPEHDTTRKYRRQFDMSLY